MMKLFIKALIIWGFICGCSSTQLPGAREVLNAEPTDKIFLACNLWHNKDFLINIENYRTEQMIAAGTELEIIEYSPEAIKFTEKKTSNIYTIIYEQHKTALSVENYMRMIFIKKNPLEQFDKQTIELIKKGSVKKGMTKDAVFSSLGPPFLVRTPDYLNNNTWTYKTAPGKYIKIVFRNNSLMEIIE